MSAVDDILTELDALQESPASPPPAPTQGPSVDDILAELDALNTPASPAMATPSPATHTMPDGTVMPGATHTEAAPPVDTTGFGPRMPTMGDIAPQAAVASTTSTVGTGAKQGGTNITDLPARAAKDLALGVSGTVTGTGGALTAVSGAGTRSKGENVAAKKGLPIVTKLGIDQSYLTERGGLDPEKIKQKEAEVGKPFSLSEKGQILEALRTQYGVEKSPEQSVIRQFVKQTGDAITQHGKELENFYKVEDPGVLDEMVQAVGSSAVFLAPGMGIARGTTALANIAPRVAAWLGIGVSSAAEAMVESGSKYIEEMAKTGDETIARDAANKLFWADLATLVVTNKVGGLFDKIPFGAKQILLSQGVNGVEEGIQQMWSNVVSGDPVMQGVGKAAAIGAVAAGPAGVATAVSENLTPGRQAQEAAAEAEPFIVEDDTDLGTKQEQQQPFSEKQWKFTVRGAKDNTVTLESKADELMKNDPSMTPEQAQRAADVSSKNDVTHTKSMAHFNSWANGVKNNTVNDTAINHWHLHGDEYAFGMSFIDESGQRQTLITKADLNNFAAFNETPDVGHEITDDLNTRFQNEAMQFVESSPVMAAAKTSDEKKIAYVKVMQELHEALNGISLKLPNGSVVKLSSSFGISQDPVAAENLLNSGKETIGFNSIAIDNAIKSAYNMSDIKGVDRTAEYWDAGLRSDKLKKRYDALGLGKRYAGTERRKRRATDPGDLQRPGDVLRAGVPPSGSGRDGEGSGGAATAPTAAATGPQVAQEQKPAQTAPEAAAPTPTPAGAQETTSPTPTAPAAPKGRKQKPPSIVSGKPEPIVKQPAAKPQPPETPKFQRTAQEAPAEEVESTEPAEPTPESPAVDKDVRKALSYLPKDEQAKIVVRRVAAFKAGDKVYRLGKKHGTRAAVWRDAKTDTYNVVLASDLTPAELSEAALHEIPGHVGQRLVYAANPKILARMRDMYQKDTAMREQIRKSYGEDIKGMNEKDADARIFNEWTAHNLQRYLTERQNEGLPAKVYNAVKIALRRIGVLPQNIDSVIAEMVKQMKTASPSKAAQSVAGAEMMREGGKTEAPEPQQGGRERDSEPQRRGQQAPADQTQTPEFARELPADEKAERGSIKDKAWLKVMAKKIKDWRNQYLDKNRGGPAEIFNENRRRLGNIAASSFRAHVLANQFDKAIRYDYGKPIDKLSDEEVQLIDAALHQPTGNPKTEEEALAAREAALARQAEAEANLPENVRAAVVAFRDHIETLSRQMLAIGLVDDSLVPTFERNLGLYANRSYQKHDDKSFALKVPEDVRNKAAALLRERYQKRIGDAAMTAEQIEKQIERDIADILYSKDAPMAILARGGKIGSKDLSILTPRGDIAPEIRALMGEYKHPIVNYARSVIKMSSMIANQNFLQTIKDKGMGSWFFEKNDPNRPATHVHEIAAEGSESMSPLNGLYTTPEIAKQMEMLAGDQKISDGWLRLYMKGVALSKIAKTAGSHASQMRNFESMIILNAIHGGTSVDDFVKSAKSIATMLREHGKQESVEYVEDAMRYGLIGEGVNAQDLVRTSQDAMDVADPLFNIDSPTSAVRKVAAMPLKLYAASDDFWKLVRWETEKNRIAKAYGLDVNSDAVKQQAAEKVSRTIPTYSQQSQLVQLLRRFPFISSFPMWSAEIARTTYEGMKLAREEMASDNKEIRKIGARRMIGYVGAAAAVSAVSAAFKFIHGIGEDDDEDLRLFGPDYQKNSHLLYVGHPSTGVWNVIDVSFLDPLSYLRKPLNAVAGIWGGREVDDAIGDAFQASLDPFVSADVFSKPLMEAIANKKIGQKGASIYPENAEGWVKATLMAAHIFDQAFKPDAIESVQRTYAAYFNKEYKGRKYDKALETIAHFGFRVGVLDVPRSLRYQSAAFARDINENYLRGLKGTGPNDVQVKQFVKGLDEMHKLVQAAQRLGIPEASIRLSMAEGGLGKVSMPKDPLKQAMKDPAKATVKLPSVADLMILSLKDPLKYQEVRQMYGEAYVKGRQKGKLKTEKNREQMKQRQEAILGAAR